MRRSRRRGGKIPPETIAVLQTRVDGKKQAQQLVKAVKSLKKIVPQESYESLMDEAREIKEDFAWKKSDRGKYVLEINDWVLSFFEEFRSKDEYKDVFIGSHSELEVVFVCGKVAGPEEYDSLMAYIESKNPPRKILADVEIGPLSGS